MRQHRVAQECESVSFPDCPVEDSIYGYRPNIGVNAFLIAAFALLAIAHLGLGIRRKTWFFCYVMVLGCIGEAIGYAGRVMMHGNPYEGIGFSIQISCLIFAPAFFAAGVYLTLKHLVLTFGEANSRIPAYLYTWIFISCDFVSLLLQAIGGGMAGSSNGDMDKLDLGTNLMIAGIVFQVATLLVFAGLVIDYIIRTRRNWENVSKDAKLVATTKQFQRFSWALLVAFGGIFLRSVYRIAELSPGWATPIMRDEISFILLEGFLILFAVVALTIFHPATTLPSMSSQKKQKLVDESLSVENGVQPGEKSAGVSSRSA